MNCMLRGKILGHDWVLRIGKLTPVLGVNSTLQDGRHILMWEFDDAEYPEICNTLEAACEAYRLPSIYIVQSSDDSHYHAYCLAAINWEEAVMIVGNCPLIDWQWFKMSVARDHFTLRLTDKGRGKPRLVSVIDSTRPDEASIADLKGGPLYEAWQREGATNA